MEIDVLLTELSLSPPISPTWGGNNSPITKLGLLLYLLWPAPSPTPHFGSSSFLNSSSLTDLNLSVASVSFGTLLILGGSCVRAAAAQLGTDGAEGWQHPLGWLAYHLGTGIKATAANACTGV